MTQFDGKYQEQYQHDNMPRLMRSTTRIRPWLVMVAVAISVIAVATAAGFIANALIG